MPRVLSERLLCRVVGRAELLWVRAQLKAAPILLLHCFSPPHTDNRRRSRVAACFVDPVPTRTNGAPATRGELGSWVAGDVIRGWDYFSARAETDRNRWE